MKIKNKIATIFTALILAFVCMLSGCSQDTSDAKEPSSEIENKNINLPNSFSYIVPCDDIRNDGDELGWYRPNDSGDGFSTEITKSSYCTNQTAIAEIYNLIDTERFKADGEITDDNQQEYDELNQQPAIHMVFDKLYYVSIYQNDVIVTQTFYTEGEKYEELANKYYAENGAYPPSISDGLWKYTSSEKTYDKVSKILLALPEEDELEK